MPYIYKHHIDLFSECKFVIKTWTSEEWHSENNNGYVSLRLYSTSTRGMANTQRKGEIHTLKDAYLRLFRKGKLEKILNSQEF